MKKYDVVVAGYICIDLTPDFGKSKEASSISNLLKPGKLIEIEGLSFTLGGAVANTGMALKRFNKKVYLNGLVGDDFIGKTVIESLSKYGLAEGIKFTKLAGTAFSIVLAPPDIDRIFLESPGCSIAFNTGHIDYEAISQSQIFHFGYPPLLKQFYSYNGDQLVQMFSEVQELGVVTSLDFSLPDTESESGKIGWLNIMHRVLPFTDIFAPSLEEALLVMMPNEYEKIVSASDNQDIIDRIPLSLLRELGKRIIDCGVKILLVKAAHRGTYLLTGNVSDLNIKRGLNLYGKGWNNREIWCPSYPADLAKIINATGAGDTAIAGFLSAILDGENPYVSLKCAAMSGRNSLYCSDLYEELTGWEEMYRELKLSKNITIDLNKEEAIKQ